MINTTHLSQQNPQQLRETVLSLAGKLACQQAEIERKDREIAFKQAFIDKLTHEMAVLKRLKFAAQSEAYNAEQKSLLEETIDTDLAALAALAAEIEQAEPPPRPDDKQRPKRQALPESSHHHTSMPITVPAACQPLVPNGAV